MPREPSDLLARDGAPPARDGPVEVLALGFGDYHPITPLNPRFVPGWRRLKMTIEVDAAAVGPAGAVSLARGLQEIAPGLRHHTCAGGRRLEESLTSRGGCGGTERPEDGLDVAHLLEHLIIDLQHFVARMKRCSGVTCGHDRPRNRYDLFVETPAPCVGRLCAALAVGLVNGLLAGGGDAGHLTPVLRVARRLHPMTTGLITRRAALPAVRGDASAADAALRALCRLGFIREAATCVNFSGLPAYESRDAEDPIP